MPFDWQLCAFSALRATLSYFDGLIYMCKYQSWFRVNQRWISAVHRRKSNVSEQRKSALNSADSELFLSETALFQFWNSADFFSSEQRWCLSYSLNQRWNTSKLWNSAVQRWLPLELQPGIIIRNWKFYISKKSSPYQDD